MKNETARREIESLDYYLQNHTNDYSEESHTAMMMAIDALSSSEKPNKWIPVSERLPEEYGEYLITWKNPKYSKTYIGICECEITDVYDHEHNRFEVEWLFDGHITTAYPDSYVIAWMPLPESYKGE